MRVGLDGVGWRRGIRLTCMSGLMTANRRENSAEKKIRSGETRARSAYLLFERMTDNDQIPGLPTANCAGSSFNLFFFCL